MLLTIDLSPELEEKLRERAATRGEEVAGYVVRLIERHVFDESGGKLIDRILAPVREGFEQSGLTPDELTALFREAREEVWKQRAAGHSPGEPGA